MTIFVTDDAQRAPFARALVNRLCTFSFEDAFAESYDFFSAIFEYLIKDYNTAGGGKYAEYYTPHAIATIMARLLVGDNYAVIRNILKNTRSLRPDDWDTEISPKKLSCVGGGSALEMCKGRLRIKIA